MPGTGLKLALAVIGGYLLGRTKKMKLAIMFGAALAGKKISTDPAQLLGQASKLIQASPELQKLDGAVRGRLLEAGKDAALAVASSRMEALTDNLVNRVENLGKPAADAAGAATQAAGQTAGAAGDAVGQAGGAVGDVAGTAGSAVGGAVGGAGGAVGKAARGGRRRKAAAAEEPVDDGVDAADEIEDVEDLDDDVDDTEESESDEAVAETEEADEPEEAPSRAPSRRRASRPPSAIVEELRQQLVEQRLDQQRHRPGASQAVVVGLVVRRQREPHQQRLDASDVVGVAQQGHRRLRLAPWIGEAR